MAKNISLNDAIDEYLSSRAAGGLAKNTLKGDRSSLMQLLKSTGNINTKSLEPRHIDRVFEEHAHNKPSARNMLLTRLRGFFRWCQQRSYITTDPTRELRKMRTQADGRLFVPLDEFDRLLDAAENPRDRMVLALGLYLFLRVSEIESLKLSDVDLDAGEVKVTVHKTGDYDVMPICQELDTELRAWLTWYAGSIDEPLSDEMFLVPSKQDFRVAPGPERGRFVLAESSVTRLKPYVPISRPWTVVQRALSELNYPTKREGGHTLRRSGARALFDSIRGTEGVDGALQQVKVMLHHKNVAMTEHYLGIAPERVQRDARLKGKPMFLRPKTAGNVIELRRTEGGGSTGAGV
jgi:integrase